ncbi:MAG: CHAP domain-containing protein [Alphaproteobacteria bacterium]|nr:CHAP domain-containing protein [Alphaproteobacteria bacterium]
MGCSVARLSLAACVAMWLGACASEPSQELSSGQVGSVTTPDKPLQCVPYARTRSGVSIFGDAYTWWDKAAGKFARGDRPQKGAVMVLSGYAGPARAHLAVVRKVVSAREISVDHANWLNDGAIYVDDPVEDVSAANDWSQVRVWNIRSAVWGTRVYPVQGFIGPGLETMPSRPLYDPDAVVSLN